MHAIEDKEIYTNSKKKLASYFILQNEKKKYIIGLFAKSEVSHRWIDEDVQLYITKQVNAKEVRSKTNVDIHGFEPSATRWQLCIEEPETAKWNVICERHPARQHEGGSGIETERNCESREEFS